jgi:MFS family permease
MQLLVPDILEDARGLGMAGCATAFVIGFLLWLFGWRGHRFWIVLVATIVAGVIGLASGRLHGAQPIVAGLLLAVAAGALSLALARVAAFGAGGVAAWLAVRALAPTWDEPLISFLVGGLIGLLLFRLWTMVLTSSAGTLLMAYAGLCLANQFGSLDAVAVARERTAFLNALCGGVALLGVVLQFLLSRRQRKPNKAGRNQRRRYADDRDRDRDRERSWWEWAQGTFRQAG